MNILIDEVLSVMLDSRYVNVIKMLKIQNKKDFNN
jgi:hypothetical protein